MSRESDRWIAWAKSCYYALFPNRRGNKGRVAAAAYRLLQTLLSVPQRRVQNARFRARRAEGALPTRLMAFLVPPTDIVSGGLLSICNIARRSAEMRELHGCEVWLSTVPGIVTIANFTRFPCELPIFRFSELETLFPGLDEVYFQLPEMCAADFLHYLERRGEAVLRIPERRLNILDQNIELMPEPRVVAGLAAFFPAATQTCAHRKYATAETRARYGIPVHLLPADIPTTFLELPYGEKENLFVYSNDPHPQKLEILAALRAGLPDYRFLMIENMTFDEYKRWIARAKWTLTFGEGWDGYFLQPYLSGSIGLCVFHETFCPAFLRTLPTVFPDYETLAENAVRFVRAHDAPEPYRAVQESVRSALFPPADPDAVPYDALRAFYQGNYTNP